MKNHQTLSDHHILMIQERSRLRKGLMMSIALIMVVALAMVGTIIIVGG